ncbi:AAA domain containing protein [uncultured Caudovirales phage]|uniref:AAA domain containing protein n=1 Tax=uncultured Caudovirales phage TaxID=2100421 RepID=A0A6J5QZK9_9CAUD|nr:AAA domain containing protein [uncultured Caudovirales phage]
MNPEPPHEEPDDGWGDEPLEPEFRSDADLVSDYRFADGRLAFKVLRWDKRNGKDSKIIRPMSWDGKAWVSKNLIPSGQRPILNLPEITENPTAPILWVEGEKKALIAKRYLPSNWIVTCYANGAEGDNSANLTPLIGRHVVAWPDNNKAGHAAAARLHEKVDAKIADLPFGIPEGWDLGDPLPENVTADQITAIITGYPFKKADEAKPDRGTRVGTLILLTDEDAANAKPRDYYLKGVISPNEMSVLYGEPGCGKSFFALYLARAIAQKRDILGRRVKQAPVLFMALEGISGFEKRLIAQISKQGGTSNFTYIAQPINLFSDEKQCSDVVEAAKKTKAGLIIIDTLNRAMGAGSENAPEDMGKFIQNIDEIRAACGAHVMIIHHSGKDASKGMRGHSALLGAADVAIEVTKDTNSKARIAKILKAKDDVDGDQFGFLLEIQELGTDPDGDPITTCTVQEIDIETGKKIAPLTRKEQLWLDTICQLFARDENIRMVAPEDGMDILPCATRDDIREWIKKRGLVGVAHSVARAGVLSATDRSTFARMLEALKIKGKIGIYGDLIWVV